MPVSLASTSASSMHGALVPIAYTSISGSTTSDVTFANIPQTYQDLMFVVNGRGSYSASYVLIQAYINGGFSGYSTTYLQGDGSSATSSRQSATSGLYLGNLPAATSTSGIQGSIVTHILNYANTSTYKTILSRNAYDLNGSGGTRLSVNMSSSTSAVTQVNIATFGVGYFTAGTTIELFGIRSVGQ